MLMKFTRKYFSLSMALLMLVMSVGITAHKMVCLVSGAVTLSFFQTTDCCSTSSNNSGSVQTKCCDFSTDYFKLDIQTLVTNFNFKFDFVTYYFTLPVLFFSDITTNKLCEAMYSPPLFTGKSIPILFSSFRI